MLVELVENTQSGRYSVAERSEIVRLLIQRNIHLNFFSITTIQSPLIRERI